MRPASLLALLALAACDTVDDGPPAIDPVDASRAVEVESAAVLAGFEQMWNVAGIDDYWLRYERFCFCAPQVVDVRVEAGVVVEAWQNGTPFPDDPVSLVLRVDDLYRIAADGFEEADAVTVRVLRGAVPLPVVVSLDPSFDVADEEVGYQIVGFKAD